MVTSSGKPWRWWVNWNTQKTISSDFFSGISLGNPTKRYKKIVPGSSTLLLQIKQKAPKNRFILPFSNCPFQLKTERDPGTHLTPRYKSLPSFSPKKTKSQCHQLWKFLPSLCVPSCVLVLKINFCPSVLKKNVTRKRRCIHHPPSPSSNWPSSPEVRRIATWPFPWAPVKWYKSKAMIPRNAPSSNAPYPWRNFFGCWIFFSGGGWHKQKICGKPTTTGCFGSLCCGVFFLGVGWSLTEALKKFCWGEFDPDSFALGCFNAANSDHPWSNARS